MNTASNSVITDVLNQNAEAAEQIKTVSNELEVVHAVLSTQLPAPQATTDLVAAVDRTDELSQQLAETAQALERSNELLRELKASGRR
ncbi:hypothetical protein [Acidovorax sp. LjRoot194]|uniref:hypothetical protein n=1 Tax=Acidovorax sp. LjRoot194 TaxID=3342280 RepID=UPI003ED16F07